MRDAYAMQLHSVPSRLSKKVIPDTSLQPPGGLEIFYGKAKRISLRHTFGYGKQLIHDPLGICTH